MIQEGHLIESHIPLLIILYQNKKKKKENEKVRLGKHIPL